MGRLSRDLARAHRDAVALAALDRDLTEDEKLFVFDHYQESTSPRQGQAGAFFTPAGLARDMAIEVVGTRVLDLGAGIGSLAFACRNPYGQRNGDPPREIVCVEADPDLVRIGRKLVPEAHWIRGDLLDAHRQHWPRFDTVIANPPFGNLPRTGSGPGYSGPRFEFHTIAVAARVARHGVFLLPAHSAPFRYSGQRFMHHDRADEETRRFQRDTGILLQPSCGIDTSHYINDWHHPPVVTEVVTAEFTSRAPHARPALRAPIRTAA